MRVLIFHGYLLRGTGSNVYNASLAQALARLGHEVHLLCQDRQAGALDWVDRVGDWTGGKLRVEGRRREGGSVTAYVPDIGGLLPVYVADRYAGFRVKTFPQLSDEELARYLDANVASVRDVADAAGRVVSPLPHHLAEPPSGYAEAARGAADSVVFAGRLEHDEVGRLVPAADALVFPSTFPEAFGMVAAEAAAAGVLPGSPGHSGAAEVSRALAASLPAEVGALLSFPLDAEAVRAIAARL